MLALLIGLAWADPLVVVGEPLGDAVVEGQMEHPDFLRIDLRLADGRLLPVEITATRPGFTGACAAQGQSAYPRWELLGEARTVEDQPPAVQALCARLAARAAPIALPAPAEAAPAPAVDAPVSAGLLRAQTPRVLRGVLVGIGLLVAQIAGRRAGKRWIEPALLFVGALLLRLLRDAVPFVGPDAAFEVLGMALGDQDPHPLYGGGYTALHALGQQLAPGSLGAVWATQAVLGAMAAPFAWALVRGLHREDPLPARFAGVAMALLPVHLLLSASEVQHIGLLTLLLLGGAALVRAEAGLLAGLCFGFAAHVRPEAIPLCGLLLGLLLLQAGRRPGAWAGLLLGAGLVLLRILDLPLQEGAGPSRLDHLASTEALLALVRPVFSLDAAAPVTGAFQVFLHPAFTPVALPLLAVLALIRQPRRVLPLALLGLVALLPVLLKSWPHVDAWRLQLVALALGVVAASLGLIGLPRRLGAVALGLVVVGSAARTPTLAADWAPHAAWRWLRAQTLPADTTLLIPDHSTHAAAMIRVLPSLFPGVQGLGMGAYLADPPPVQGLIAWIGPTCALAELPGRREAPPADPCAALQARCALVPLQTTTLPARGDLDLVLRADPVAIGLFRVDGCSPAGSPP